MKYLRLLLFPFSLLYGAVVWCRNRLYDWGWLRQTGFDRPVIVVGNLEVGGTGKSPMTEYLIRLLKDRYRLATLSRGYGRRTKGFLEVAAAMDARDVGDEPLQFKQKFPGITVAVAEDRVSGIRQLWEGHELFLLDDAYQHRALKPGLSILLFDYNRLKDPPVLLPAGNLRDQLRERRRADIMVVTKCPEDPGREVKQAIRKRLEVPGRNIPVFLPASITESRSPIFRMSGRFQPRSRRDFRWIRYNRPSLSPGSPVLPPLWSMSKQGSQVLSIWPFGTTIPFRPRIWP